MGKTELLYEYFIWLYGYFDCSDLIQGVELEKLFNSGVRDFYGVILDENGFLLYDELPPEEHSLNRFLSVYFGYTEEMKEVKKNDTN